MSQAQSEKAPSKGAQTRERILELAEATVLQKGFAATSIDELIAASGITKSGFLYHFHDKQDLARALLQRYLDKDKAILDSIFSRAEALNEDPLHGFLVGLKFFAEMMADLPNAHPGCLAASFTYQDQLFSRDIREMNQSGLLAWRKRFRATLDRIAERYPPKVEVDLDALSDMLTVLVDGGITTSRALGSKRVLPDQVILFRTFIRSIFMP